MDGDDAGPLMAPSFGRLTQIPLRSGWSNEATHFTPWLAQADNLRLLADSIAVPLELQSTEERVGPFRADIVCRCPDNDSLVLIENQIERTDHGHLGQLLTYMAGLETATVVWVAAQFTEEHRGALDWLNRMTRDELRFFGLEIELWRIGDSPFAPKFNVVVRPNDVVRTAAALTRTTITPLGEARRAYWAAFGEALNTRHGRFRLDRSTAASTVDFPLRDPRYALVAYRAQGGAGIYLRAPRGPEATDWIRANLAELESKLEMPIAFKTRDGGDPAPQIDVSLKADPNLQEDWLRQHGWLGDQLDRLSTALEPYLGEPSNQNGRTDHEP
jgi:hypothetical protein